MFTFARVTCCGVISLPTIAIGKETVSVFLGLIIFIHSFIHSESFYSASSSPLLLLRGAPDYSVDIVLELARRCTTDIYE